MEVILYTDGSSRGNPGPGGWGAILLTKDIVKEIGGRDKETTNNRMELTATIQGLEEVIKLQATGQKLKVVTVKTDSEYVKKGISAWITGWLARGWKTAANKPVLNQELWQELLANKRKIEAEAGSPKVEFVYVKAHAGVVLNERADEIATTYADNEPTKLYDGPRAHYMV